MIGPGDVHLTMQAITNNTGEIKINIKEETIISSNLLNTIFIPFSGVSKRGTTGTPLIYSVRDCNILNVKTSGINNTEQVVSVNCETIFFIFRSSLILRAI